MLLAFIRPEVRAWLAVAVLAAGVWGLVGPVEGGETKGMGMSYGEAREFLAKHTQVVELAGPNGARVAVCPAWQGRVMTSTCGGLEGPSFGFINREFIEAGKHDPRFNNYGAEDRMWLSPEGGPFSLWFKPGVEQTLANWFTPPALNEGAFEPAGEPSGSCFRMTRRMQFQNTAGTKFDLDVIREVRLLAARDLAELFGPQAADAMSRPGVKWVGYETNNTITNRGPAMTKATGLVSIWMLGMLNSGPKTVILVPYRPGDEAALGPAVKSDYFGPIPASRLKTFPEAILFRADGNYRAKIGTSQRRAREVLGSIDFESGALTLVRFNLPADPSRCDYLNNMWGPQQDSYLGDVANAYNDGPPEPGKKGLGPFYEIESLSPAAALATGQSLTHRHRTIHLRADRPTLDALARTILGVELEKVQSAMFPK